MADMLLEIDWSTVPDEDIPCAQVGKNYNNENLWLHPSGEVRQYKNWWYLDDDGRPANAVDSGLLTEMPGTARLAKEMDKMLAQLNTSKPQ